MGRMSSVIDAIEAKKRGGKLPDALIAAVVEGYTSGDVPDYQMAALLMAIRLVGLDYDETVALTRTMADSGPRYSFPDCVDKHSTGGVGDKVTLCALPVVAACGVPVAKLSGRGLGITGGTIDKLEAIPGFGVALTEAQFRRQVEEVGFALGEAGELAPADKAIYALRDTTGTVDSMPLIGSSIVSKKVATGAGHLIYDVKAGSGAFMQTLDDARELAQLLVKLSEALGINARAIITDMDTALGAAVGNALEVRESVAFLRGETVPGDLDEVCRDVAAELLELRGIDDPRARVDAAIADGSAYAKLEDVVRAQGGDVEALGDLPVAEVAAEVTAPRAGVVGALDALGIARASLALGAGRQKKGDALDFGAGVVQLVRPGDTVEAGQPVVRLHGSRGVAEAVGHAEGALTLTDEAVAPRPHVLERL
jgi:thymidine phosphorylase